MPSPVLHTEIAVLGAGPGGYAAAFQAADRGKSVVVIDEGPRLGGICLNHGCIPSKALLHATQLIRDTPASAARGIVFDAPRIDVPRLRAWKTRVLDQLASGLAHLMRQRQITVVAGRGRFDDSHTLHVDTPQGPQRVTYAHAIIAVGSQASIPRAFRLESPRVMTSTEALALEGVPGDLLVVGGGYIGMELGTVYAALGSRVVLVEATDTILGAVDADLVRPILGSAQRMFREVRLNTTVTQMAVRDEKISATLDAQGARVDELYDRVLIAVGRVPNADDIGLEQTRVERDAQGFITVDASQATTDPAIYAVGDVVGGPLLAHKASHEARVAVDAITGCAARPADVVIPAVVFTDPELAWCGLTEAQAHAQRLTVRVTRVPWAASGRAVSMDRSDGLTKLVIDPQTERMLGVGIVGLGAGELISEGVLAVQLGVRAEELARAIHPHPTLSETLKECAELFYGSSTHVASRHHR